MMHPPQSRIELVCVLLPNQATRAEIRRYQATKHAWSRAADIAHRAKIQSRFAEQPDRGCTIGDGYLYPPLSLLEQILSMLEAADVPFDNVDLPDDAPAALVRRLERRFPRGAGVMVNPGEYHF